MKLKFPKKLYVKIGDDGSNNEYFDPHVEIDTTVEAGERAKIAIYELADIVEARGSVTVISTKSLHK